MARLNIEEHAFSDSRLFLLARKLNMDFRHVLGILVWVWHESQQKYKTKATREQLKDWAVETDFKFIDEAISVGYFRKSPNGELEYIIAGNESQISSMEKWYEQKKVAGKKSAEARKTKKLEQNFNEGSTTVQRPFNDRSTKVNEGST